MIATKQSLGRKSLTKTSQSLIGRATESSRSSRSQKQRDRFPLLSFQKSRCTEFNGRLETVLLVVVLPVSVPLAGA
jgi:hypothetical protein